MSLPRPRSILDATPLRGAFATNVVSTGAPKRAAEDAAPSSGGGDCDITECSDAEFNKWLEKQFPTPGMERWFNDQMMQAWMTLTTAATEALTEFASMSYNQSRPAMPEPPTPHYLSLKEQPDYEALHASLNAEQAAIVSHREKATMLLQRARSVQTRISFVV